MIDSQGGPERERLGMTWTLFLFISPGKGALTHHPPLAGGGMALRPPGDGGWGGSAVSFPPAPVYTADANGGLGIGRRCFDILGLGRRQPPTSCAGYIPRHCLLLLSTSVKKG